MKLSTFGAVLRFAIDLEEAAAKRYANIAPPQAQAAATLSALAGDSQKRAQMLTRVRQENITEMILEPITDLDGDDYQTEPGPTDEKDFAGFLQMALESEERAQRFYLDSAVKAKFLLAEVGRIFERLARENGERQAKLRALQQ